MTNLNLNLTIEDYKNMTEVELLDIRYMASKERSIVSHLIFNVVSCILHAKEYFEIEIDDFHAFAPTFFDLPTNKTIAEILHRFVETQSVTKQRITQHAQTTWAINFRYGLSLEHKTLFGRQEIYHLTWLNTGHKLGEIRFYNGSYIFEFSCDYLWKELDFIKADTVGDLLEIIIPLLEMIL